MRKIPRVSKIAVAMSGGVDSGVAAALLVEQGYEVIGLFMEHLDGVGDQLDIVQATAEKLNIEFHTVDYRPDFKDTVIQYFLDEYRAGRTPNPCVVCNKWIKFGKLLDYAKGLGCDFLATGHYARTQIQQMETDSHRYKLLRGVDEKKDQSYFLWQLSQEQLKHILFPIGELTKGEVRKLAHEKKLPVAERPESFEVCFVPDSIGDFLRRQIPEEIVPGPVVNTKGEVVGNHQGLPLYTYGQRRGFKLSGYTGIPLYVVGIDKDQNTLIVGRGRDSEVSEFEIEETNWIGENAKWKMPNGKCELRCLVRIRHQGELLHCRVRHHGLLYVVSLDEPTRAVTPGQSAVFYRGEEVLGGSVVSSFVGS